MYIPQKTLRCTNDLKIVWKPAKQVQITQKDSEETVWTTAQTVERFLKEQNISFKRT